MSKKMLIDASHPEETRVVIVDGTQVEELDFESRAKRQLRGNVYLARVTRVEPSLQAAFIEYGGNRHGFLAFSEIHPDYYQIPHEDKLKLLEAEEADNKAEEEALEAAAEKPKAKKVVSDDTDDDESDDDLDSEDSAEDEEDDDDDIAEEIAEAPADEADVVLEQAKVASSRRKRMSRRRYKIQEVIKRGQILLVQAVKEERGNKGAAMTTYMSLAGRYCVLMPNTPRGGGISRKIANGSDRKRLKTIMSGLEVPQGMGVIVRTAGAKQTKTEITRDYDYLSRLWSEIRETTLSSTAPALIHEEGNLVKRSIRDLYNKDIEEILVQGEDAYKTASDFIEMLMPSHAKNVKEYKDPVPLYLRYEVEKQIEASLDSVVQLKSGGYLVIHPTEALVSVDVNSGRSTKERNVERTALKTNLEAASEVARQMRLRDLAGLIVIDFIDMDENKNNRAVEKRMKDDLARDRARVQTSRISQFGLMEISRQRRRRSLLEGSTANCEHCDGVGRKRTIESSALRAIRAVEEIGVRGRANRIKLKVSKDVALYLINEKRELLQHVDGEFDMFTELVGDESLIRPAFEFEVTEAADNDNKDPLEEIEKEWRKERQKRGNQKNNRNRGRQKSANDSDNDEESGDDESENKSRNNNNNQSRNKPELDENGEPRKRRRRRGRRGGRNKQRDNQSDDGENTQNATSDNDVAPKVEADTSTEEKPKGRGRGRRRAAPKEDAAQDEAKVETNADVQPEAEEKPARKTRSTNRRAAPKRKTAKMDDTAAPEAKAEEPAEKPARKSTARKKAPVKKAPAKKAPAKKPAAKKAPAKKAPAKKAPAKKAPAKKPATKAPVAKKAPAKKVSAAKKAPAKAKAAPKPAAKDAAKPAATARRKAPARVAEKETSAPKATPKPSPAPTPAPAAKKPEAKPAKDAAPKKRGWWQRKK